MRTTGIVALALLVGACAESDASVEAPRPRPRDVVDREFIESAERALNGTDGRNVGVILSEDGDGWDAVWSVMLPNGDVTLIEPSFNCDDGDDVQESQLWVILDPGDLVRWTDDGDDNRVCTNEIEVTKAAAAP